MSPEGRIPRETDMEPIPILYSGNTVTVLGFQCTMCHWHSVSKADKCVMTKYCSSSQHCNKYINLDL
jgi:hypothetical protein